MPDTGDRFREAADTYQARWDAAKHGLRERLIDLVKNDPILRRMPNRVRRDAARRAAVAIQTKPEWADIVRALRRQDDGSRPDEHTPHMAETLEAVMATIADMEASAARAAAHGRQARPG